MTSGEGVDSRVEACLKRLRWALGSLPAGERDEIVRETRSHFLEKMAGEVPDEAYEETVAQLGEPEA